MSFSERDECELLLDIHQTSTRERDDHTKSTLQIQAWGDGVVSFTWAENGAVKATVELCANAFFSMMMEMPAWFAEAGKPAYYGGCGSSTTLVCLHDEEYPEIVMGALQEGAEETISIVVLDRGTLISHLDACGHKVAVVENPKGCAALDPLFDESEDGEEEVSETQETPSADDPFSGLDMTKRH